MRKLLEPILGFIACQTLVMLVSAASLLPFLALAKNSIADALAGPLPPQAALTIALPDIFGHLSGKYNLAGTDSTTTYFFVGLVLELALVAAFFARSAIARSSKGYVLAGIFVFVNAALEFLPLGQWGFGRVPGFEFIRPQTAGMPFALAFASLVIMILVAADRVLVSRLQLALRIGAVIAVLSMFVNVPGVYSTPAGPATDVDANSPGFVGGGIPDDRSIIAIDQSTIGGSADNWPRVLGTRVLGGEDPLAQRSYLDLLDSRGVHNSGRRVYFSNDADFAWLAANGVGLVMSTAPSIEALAVKAHWNLIQRPPYFPMWSLPSAIPIADAKCAKALSVSLGVDVLDVHYDGVAPNCTVRLTSNYSESFTADRGVRIDSIPGELGMTLSNLPTGTNDVVVSYVNRWAIIGRWISLGGLAIIASWLLSHRVLRKRASM